MEGTASGLETDALERCI